MPDLQTPLQACRHPMWGRGPGTDTADGAPPRHPPPRKRASGGSGAPSRQALRPPPDSAIMPTVYRAPIRKARTSVRRPCSRRPAASAAASLLPRRSGPPDAGLRRALSIMLLAAGSPPPSALSFPLRQRFEMGGSGGDRGAQRSARSDERVELGQIACRGGLPGAARPPPRCPASGPIGLWMPCHVCGCCGVAAARKNDRRHRGIVFNKFADLLAAACRGICAPPPALSRLGAEPDLDARAVSCWLEVRCWNMPQESVTGRKSCFVLGLETKWVGYCCKKHACARCTAC